MSRYSDYTDTGIEWIGDIPNKWNIKPLFTLLQENKTKNILKNKNVLTLSYGEIKLRDLSKNRGLLPENFEGYQVVKNGYIIIRSTDLQNDKKSLRVGLVHDTGVITSAYLGLIPSKEVSPGFIYQYLNMCDLKKVFYGLGGGLRQSLRFDDFKRFPLLVPPPHEQNLISRYLDNKTSQIDSLIEKIEQKIELLKEQRTSLINQCVTKGLNPDVEMKDSGVEWIGEIPKHWDLKKLKYIVSYNTEALTDQTDPSYEFTYIEIGDVDYIDGISYKSKTVFSDSPSRARRVLRNGDVIISTVRTYLRAIGFIDREDDLIGSTGFCVLRSSKEVSGKYLSYAVRSEWFISDVISNSEGVSYPAINSSDLVNLKITLPPLNEQIKIEKMLNVEIERFDDLISKETKRIELLKEYRQSLISNAVTGKVKITEEMI